MHSDRRLTDDRETRIQPVHNLMTMGPPRQRGQRNGGLTITQHPFQPPEVVVAIKHRDRGQSGILHAQRVGVGLLSRALDKLGVPLPTTVHAGNDIQIQMVSNQVLITLDVRNIIVEVDVDPAFPTAVGTGI